jgi:exonuclease VII large subunit
VSTYAWGSYEILDTPGVDAPIEHEEVTREQMVTADAIVFVVDPLGTVEEAKTLEVLLDMVRARRQIYLVFNEKKPVDAETFVHLKDQLRGRLQALAAAQGLPEVLKDIPISKVNARRALQGWLRQQPALVEASGFPAFEQQLATFLQSVGPDAIYGRLRQQLQDFLEAAAAAIQAASQSELVRKYDRLLQRVNGERSRLAQDMKREIARQRTNLHDMSVTCMRTAPDECQDRIEGLLRKAGEQVATSLQAELQAVLSLVQAEIDEFHVGLPDAASTGMPGPAPVFRAYASGDAGEQSEARGESEAGVPSIQIHDAVTQLGALAKPEHIVSGLKVVKNVMPSLMKGIGIKTMEKWGAAVVGKWIPYVGVAVTVGQGLYALFRGDPEEERLREQHAEQQRARERAVQQMEDFARELADGLETSMLAIVGKESEEFFVNVNGQVEVLRQGFSDAEQDNTRRLEQVLDIQRLVASA